MAEEKVPDVTLPKDQFDALMARIARLENPGIPVKTKRVTEHVGFLRMWEGKLVIRIGSAIEDFTVPENNPNRLVIDIGTIDEAGTQVKTRVNYLEFLTRAQKMKVKFLKIERFEREETDPLKGGGGSTTRIDPEKGRFTGDEIDLVVGFTDVKVEVEVTEGPFIGKKFSFDEKAINALNA